MAASRTPCYLRDMSRVGSLVLASCCIVGCSNSPIASVCRDESRALYGVTSSDGPSGMSPQQQAAIGGLIDEADLVLCSAFLVKSGYGITAKHCSGAVMFTTTLGAQVARVAIGRTFVHPNLDLKLIELPRDALSAIEPVVLSREAIGPERVGDSVTLAGLGQTEQGTSGQRLFLDETIVGVDDSAILVRGNASSGACHGDSGGPLLARRDGQWVVLGALSKGSESCRGLDSYDRIDVAVAWIEATIESSARDREPDSCFQ